MLDPSVRIQEVAARLGWEPVSTESAPGGHINDSFFVDTQNGRYVLQRLNGKVFADVDGITSNLLRLCAHLGGGLVPTPVAATDGSWLVHVGSERWRAFERVAGASPLEGGGPELVAEAGGLLGRFHARIADLDPTQFVDTMPGFHDPRRRLQALDDVAAADPRARVKSVGAEIDALRAAAPLVDVADEITVRGPLRVAHNDAKLDNFLFRDGRAICLIDLDTLMPGRWFWDVGDLLRSATTTAAEDEADLDRVVLDRARYDAVVAGYRRGVSNGPVTSAELEALDYAGAIVTYEQALRFLTDWLAGDVYYRTSRPGQNLDRARTQLKLLASMPNSPL